MQVLNENEYDRIKVIFKNATMLEFSILSSLSKPEEIDAVKGAIVYLTTSVKLYKLFTQAGLELIVDNVFENVIFRDFILGVCDRFYCDTAFLLSCENQPSIEKTIATGLGNMYSSTNNFNITPEKIAENIYVDSDTVLGVLTQNKWLVIVVLIILFAEQAEDDNLTKK